VLENEWDIECEWLPSQTDLSSARVPFMISRKLIILVADLGEECSDFSDSSSLEELLSDFSDSLSLVDLPLIRALTLSLEGASVGFLEDSLSEVNRGSFGLSLLFFANGVALLFFDAEGSCHLWLEDVLVILSLLFLNLCPFSVQMAMDSRYLSCLLSLCGTLSR
jgi:hypothetical protein